MEIDMEQLKIDCDRELTLKQSFRMVWWSFVNVKKLEAFMAFIKRGDKEQLAYDKAKNYKPLKKYVMCLGPTPPRCSKQCVDCKKLQKAVDNPKSKTYTPERLKKMKDNYNAFIKKEKL